MDKRLMWFLLFVGSTVGGYVPQLWGAGFLSLSGVLFSALGGVLGIWVAFKIS